jgi:hypothetical protein
MIPVLKSASEPYPEVKVQSFRENPALENGFNARAGFDGAEVGGKVLQIPHVFSRQSRDRELFARE